MKCYIPHQKTFLWEKEREMAAMHLTPDFSLLWWHAQKPTHRFILALADLESAPLHTPPESETNLTDLSETEKNVENS